MPEELEKRAEEFDREMCGANLPFVRRHNKEAEKYNRERFEHSFSGKPSSGMGSFSIRGTYFTFRDLCRSLLDKGKKILMDYFNGEINYLTMQKKICEEVYGHGKGLHIIPSEEDIRKMLFSPSF